MLGRHLYLSDYPDHYLTGWRPLCHRSSNYDTVDIAKKIGNCQIVALKTTIDREWKCPQLHNLNYDQCHLEICIGGSLKPKEVCGIPQAEIMLMKIGTFRIPSDIRLGSLAGWQHLYAECKCGHIGRLDHEKHKKKFGDCAVGALTGKSEEKATW